MNINNPAENIRWSENVILADTDYVDKVAFHLTVNFERMIGRRIPKADFARWIDCIALDGGLREKKQTDGEEKDGKTQETLVILVHRKENSLMENFTPGNYTEELDGKAFKDHLGEFIISACPIESIAGGENLFTEALQLILEQKEVKRLMVIPDFENAIILNKVREILRKADDDDKRITVFTMDPTAGGNYRQEILGYSLMAALGIKGDELRE